LPEVESAVVAHKTYNRVELLIDEPGIVADGCDPDHGDGFTVLVIDLCDGDVKPALESPNEAFHDTSFPLQRANPLQGQMSCHHTNNHFRILSFFQVGKQITYFFSPFTFYSLL
jgi:hypothetical protein